MNFFRKFFPILLLLTWTCTLSAQDVRTWIAPATAPSVLTCTTDTNQMMEIICGSFDANSSIEITSGTETYIMNGTTLILPFTVGGSSTVAFRRTSNSGNGLIVTYRISTTSYPAANSP
jgi:hypothetical protein